MITSLLDNDKYKITIGYFILRTAERMGIDMPHAHFRFKNRGGRLKVTEGDVVRALAAFKKLTFTDEDIKYIMSFGCFDKRFAAQLALVNLQEVNTMVYTVNGEICIDVDGPWFPATLFEVPVLAMISEMNCKGIKPKRDKFLEYVPAFYDYGTRRRFSKDWHDKQIRAGRHVLNGTSNMFFAKKYGMHCVGTQAHEPIMAFQALTRLETFQQDFFNNWMLTFRGANDTALTDTVGLDAFLRQWDEFFMKNYSTLRQDSGDPFVFIDKVSKHYNYEYLPTMLFSNNLDAKSAREIMRHCMFNGNIKHAFGIGTKFTNSINPASIVMKLARINGEPVAKISDDPGKYCSDDPNLIRRLREL